MSSASARARIIGATNEPVEASDPAAVVLPPPVVPPPAVPPGSAPEGWPSAVTSKFTVTALPLCAPVTVTVCAPSSVGAVTAKTVQAFAECFTQAQDRQDAAWAFAPSRHGGTFSNLGAAGVSKPYFIVISDRGNRRMILLDNVKAGSPAASGVSQCA